MPEVSVVDKTLDGLADDLSSNFHRVKSKLKNDKGETFLEFRKGLTPKYFVVWRNVALVYFGFVLVSAALCTLEPEGLLTRVLLVLLGAAALGYLLHAMALFMHEASHYNVATGRRSNDLLANIFFGVRQGANISDYRPLHWGHHRELRKIEDPENHYFT